MNKKTFGLVLTALIIGAMVVMMVKSNVDNNETIDVVGSATTTDKTVEDSTQALSEKTGLGQFDTPPDFELTTLDGDLVKLSDLKGKKVMLNFWASWCGPCKAEMPHMQTYYEKHKDDGDFEMIAVNLSTSERRGHEGIVEFVEEYGLTFPIPLDEDGKVGDMYSVISIPTTYMLSTDGTIAQKIIGPMDENMMRDLIDSLE